MIAIVYLLLPGRRLSTNLQTARRSHNDFQTCVSCTFEISMPSDRFDQCV